MSSADEQTGLLGTRTDKPKRSGMHPACIAVIVVAVVAVVAAAVVCAVLFWPRDEQKHSIILVPESDCFARIGRWEVESTQRVIFSWSGSGFIVKLSNTNFFSILVGHNNSVDPRVMVLVDEEEAVTRAINTSDEILVTDLDSKEHTVQLIKLSETRDGPIYFDGIRVYDRYTASKPRKNTIEFIGDSITCGYGVLGENSTCPFSPETEDPSSAHGWLAARILNVFPNLVSWSGIGVAYNNVCTRPGHEMPEAYRYLFGATDGSEPVWNFTEDEALCAVSYLGTNDWTCENFSSTVFMDKYKQFWEFVLGHTSYIHAVCGSFDVCQYVKEAVDSFNRDYDFQRVFYDPVIPYVRDERLLGCVGHPNTVAQALIAAGYVQSVAAQNSMHILYSESPRINIGTIWGPDYEDGDLYHHCGDFIDNYEYNTFLISGLKYFPQTDLYNYSLLDVNNKLCFMNFTDRPGLQDCRVEASFFTLCRMGPQTKFLLTIGGNDVPDGSYNLQSVEEAESFAQEVWDTYLYGDGQWRPFFNDSLDGINLDIRQGNTSYYSSFVNKLVELNNNCSKSKGLIVSVTTSGCVYSEDELLPGVTPDNYIVRFMDTDGGKCDIASPDFVDTLEGWFNATESLGGARIHLLVPTDHAYTLPYDMMVGIGDLIKNHGEDVFGGIIFDKGYTDDAIAYARTYNTLFKI